MLSMLVLAVVCAVGIVLAVLLCLLATCLLCRGGGGRKASVDIKAYQAVNDCQPPSSVCVTSSPAFLANLKSSSSSSPSPARQASEKSHQLLEQVAKNNNESGSEDLQICQDSQTAQSRACSVSASSRASTRTDHVTDDNSSISTRSDVSADSSSFDHSFGCIRPDLYPRKDIVLQQSSLDAGQGRLHSRLKYDFRTCDLVVHLIEAQDLPVPDPASGTFGDPYIRVSLVPSVDERVRQSSVKRRTVNPYFNEYFKFPLDFDDLKEKSLIFHLFDYDRFSRHTPVGEVEICMADVDVSNSVEMWCDIQRQHKVVGESGEILISLSYLPAAERLTTVVMKARELRLPATAATADPFVRVSLIVDGRKIKRKKTSVKRGSSNPVWNEALSFNVPAEVLPKVTLEVTVLDHDLIGHGEMLGRCFIGGTEEGHDHWKDMLTNQRKSVAMWHILRK